MPAIFGIIGWKNSGKTTLITKLLDQLQEQKVAVIKHADHRFDIDHKGKDSHRFREHGAHRVLIASQARVADIQEAPLTLPELVARVLDSSTPPDLILVEGFKRESHPKAVIVASETEQTPLWLQASQVKAVVTPRGQRPDNCSATLPVFARDSTELARDLWRFADDVQRFLDRHHAPTQSA